jgi:hypothetical protein
MLKNKHEHNCQALPFGEYDGQKFRVDGKLLEKIPLDEQSKMIQSGIVRSCIACRAVLQYMNERKKNTPLVCGNGSSACVRAIESAGAIESAVAIESAGASSCTLYTGIGVAALLIMCLVVRKYK